MLLRKTDDASQAILACRGTAARWNATGGIQSAFNNLSFQIGIRAVVGNWDDLQAYLLKEKIQEISVYGKSQGGAHAQMLAPLIETKTSTKVQRVVLHASVGVDQKVADIFNDVFENKETPVTSYYNDGPLNEWEVDLIPNLGGRHVGKAFYSLVVGEATPQEEIKNQFLLVRLYYLLASFKRSHLRQNTLLEYQKFECDSRETDPVFEWIRYVAAYIFHIITLGFANPVCYKAFYDRKIVLEAI